MAEGGGIGDDSEKTTFGNDVRNKIKYGSTTATGTLPVLSDNAEFYIKHEVRDGESLTSIALRYGLKNTHIQRANHLWNDCIFWCPVLYIPIFSREMIPQDYKGEILTKTDLPSSRLQQTENQQNGKSEATLRTDVDPATDYFAKFDTSLAQIKDSLDKIEKRSNFPQDGSDNPLQLLSRKKSGTGQRSWSSGIESLDPTKEPEMRFLSQTNRTRVRTPTLERLEKAQDELFQL